MSEPMQLPLGDQVFFTLVTASLLDFHTNLVDRHLEQIIASPSTRFTAWCRAQEIREARRAARQGSA